MGGGMNRDRPLDRPNKSNRHVPWYARGRKPRVYIVRTPYDTKTNGRAHVPPENQKSEFLATLVVIVQFIGLMLLLVTMLLVWFVMDAR